MPYGSQVGFPSEFGFNGHFPTGRYPSGENRQTCFRPFPHTGLVQFHDSPTSGYHHFRSFGTGHLSGLTSAAEQTFGYHSGMTGGRHLNLNLMPPVSANFTSLNRNGDGLKEEPTGSCSTDDKKDAADDTKMNKSDDKMADEQEHISVSRSPSPVSNSREASPKSSDRSMPEQSLSPSSTTKSSGEDCDDIKCAGK